MGNKVSIYDIAEYCGTSAATVSYVINGKKKVSEEMRKKVYKAIKELGYTPNYTARALSTGKTKLIGILLPLEDPSIAFLQNPFYVEFIGGFEKRMSIENYDVVIGSERMIPKIGEWASSRNLDGLVLIGSHEKVVYDDLKAINVPVVLVDDVGDIADGFNNIRSNDKEGMYRATKYLIECGHTKIGFVGNSLLYPIDKRRFDGYVQAMEEVGYSISDDFIFVSDATFDSGMKIAEEIINRNSVTAVVCIADILAVGIIKKYNELSLNVPDALSIVGYDDIQVTSFIHPSLTTIHQDTYDKGTLAADMLMKTIKSEDNLTETIIRNPYLVERDSVKKINNV